MTVQKPAGSTLPQDQQRHQKDKPTWQDRANAHRASLHDKIPTAWRLSDGDIADAREQINLTGPYIEKYLSDDEVAITQTDSLHLLERMGAGAWTARRVAEAFCKRAALAEQMVRIFAILIPSSPCQAVAFNIQWLMNGSCPLEQLPS